MRVLDLGCGRPRYGKVVFPDADYVGVDADPAVEPDVVADVCDLPADLGRFDVIFASHILEHLPRLSIINALKHWCEFLLPGGKLHVLVPDVGWAAQEITRIGTINTALLLLIYGGGETELLTHRMGFTLSMLRGSLGMAGLKVVEATLGAYPINIVTADGNKFDLEARHIYVVGLKPTEEET